MPVLAVAVRVGLGGREPWAYTGDTRHTLHVVACSEEIDGEEEPDGVFGLSHERLRENQRE